MRSCQNINKKRISNPLMKKCNNNDLYNLTWLNSFWEEADEKQNKIALT